MLGISTIEPLMLVCELVPLGTSALSVALWVELV